MMYNNCKACLSNGIGMLKKSSRPTINLMQIGNSYKILNIHKNVLCYVYVVCSILFLAYVIMSLIVVYIYKGVVCIISTDKLIRINQN